MTVIAPGHNSGGFLTLPKPPSVNELYRNAPGKGRVKTIRYQTWLRAAENQAIAQPRWHVSGAYVLDLTVRRGNVRADLDNTVKAVSDALVRWGYVEDDRHMTELKVRWGDVEGCEVRIWPVMDTPEGNEQRATAKRVTA